MGISVTDRPTTRAPGVPLLRCLPRPAPRRAAAALIGSAGFIHLTLIPDHFEEGLLFGVSFAVMAVLQLGIAGALLARPGPMTDALGRHSSVVLVALYLLTRVVPVPGELEPGQPELLGTVAVGVEVSAVWLLSRLPRRKVPRLRPRAVGLLAGSGTALALLLATSSLRWIPFDLSGEHEGSAPVFIWRDYGGEWSTDSPRIIVYFTNHLVLFGSLLVLALMLVLAIEVGITVARSRARLLSGRRERRHVFWMPAFLAAPVCCGAPLFGIVGPTAFSFLVRYGWIPLLAAVWIGAASLAYESSWHASPQPSRGARAGVGGRGTGDVLDRRPPPPGPLRWPREGRAALGRGRSERSGRPRRAAPGWPRSR